jgi:hypothetical protein
MGTNGTDVRNHAQHALAGWQDDGTAYLQGLDDSAFLIQWSAVRYRLAFGLPSKTSPEYSTLRRLYQAMTDDYRRRAGGWANASQAKDAADEP